MTRRKEHVTPEQFHAMHVAMADAEKRGCGPGDCVLAACEAAGIKPPSQFDPVEIVVDSWLLEVRK